MAPTGSDALTDPELLERWIARRDEAAFEALVWRHGTMVLNICRRLLSQEHDAEDAFQATFLVLARKAGSIGKRGSLGAWLYRVAYHTALAAREKTARQARHEQPLVDLPAPAPPEDEAWRELRPVLDEEVNRLPEKYRVPFVLCYLEGLTNEQAAQQLGCPRGTVGTRLAWARERLRQRLSRRGLALSSALLDGMLSRHATSASLPLELAVSTVGAASRFVSSPGTAPSEAAFLAEGVVKAMVARKLGISTLLLVVLGLIGVSVGAFTYRALAGDQADAKIEPPPAVAPTGRNEPREDKDRLQGTWTVIAHDTLGRPASKEFLARKHQWVFRGDKLTLKDKDGVGQEGTFRIDPRKKPRVLDATFPGGLAPGARAVVPEKEILRGIYDLDGDNLKICYSYSPRDRPTEFVSRADPPAGLVVLRREPPARGEKDAVEGKPKSAPLEIRLITRKDTYTLDLGGQTRGEFLRHVREEEGMVTDRPASLPPAVAVDLVLELRNTSQETLELTLGGDASTLTLELQGPGALSVVSQRSFTEKPVPGTPVTISPGKSHSLPITSLSWGKRNTQYRAWWTRAGDYTLTAKLMTTRFREPFVSAPLELKVVDKKTADPVQVRLVGPAGMKGWLADAGGRFGKEATVEVPGRVNLPPGRIYRLKLAEIPGRPGLELYPTLELPEPQGRAATFLADSAIPIEFTEADFDRAVAGREVVMRVVYLTDPKRKLKAPDDSRGEVRAVVSHELAGSDAVVEARRRGTILAVVRLGNIDPER
jgi:RNA polymerase sigma factor (sigma-70 family)